MALSDDPALPARPAARDDQLPRLEDAVRALRPGLYPPLFSVDPDLAIALGRWSAGLSLAGRPADALAAIEESIWIWREIATGESPEYRHRLARALRDLSARLAHLNRPGEALTAVEEAVGIHRELAARRPDTPSRDLASTLTDMSRRLNALARREEAVAAVDEAIAIHRNLIADRLDQPTRRAAEDRQLQRRLARALVVRADQLRELGRMREAVAAGMEAVDRYRDLITADPDRYSPELAHLVRYGPHPLGWLASAVGMTSDELFQGYLHPDLEAEEHWTRPGRDTDSRRRIREAVVRQQRYGHQPSRLPAGKLRWEQREAAAVADKALDVLRAAGVVLSAGLTEQELDSVERRLNFFFARDHRALFRAALPVGDGWPPWRDADDSDLAWRLKLPFDGVLGEVGAGRYWPPTWGDRPTDPRAALILAADKLRDWELLVPVFRHNYLSASSCPVFSVIGTDITFAGADLPDYLRREFFPTPPLEPPLGPMDGYSPPWSDIAEGWDMP